MEINAGISSKLHIAVVTFAAQHGLGVETVVARALSEFLIDVESGLLTSPEERNKALYRQAARTKEMVATSELFGVRARRGRMGRNLAAEAAARAANVSSGQREQPQKGTVS